ncbi:hypothetical protein BIV60_27490 [Bacillus sp. MUM 116]|nr:hypothetical protein BIV60_27490 [Bacillus sp. MUM 116]
MVSFTSSFLFVIFGGFKTWLSRKKESSLSAPPKVSSGISISFITFMVILGIIMPLFGLSLIVVAIIDGIIYFINKGNNVSIAK